MLKEYCADRVVIVDQALKDAVAENGFPPVIYEAMRYSLLSGGKRLRPILLMAAAEAVGGKGDNYLDVACGLEMIHTYSLIHDDLPAMDNDDYRRGRLTNHKVYGEGMAVLAGDGLLTAAFEIMLGQPGVEPAVLLKVVREIAQAAGPGGMVGGQALDLASEGREVDADILRRMHEGKTGALFKAALRAGALLAGGSEAQVNNLTEYGEYFGLAFQITDDILDITGSQEVIGKPVGSDVKNQKATYVTMYGLEGANVMAREAVDRALTALKDFGPEADVLRELAMYLLTRNS
ncbi:MAG: polyprenyl synthetase family protein [Negativicutes bacterium]|nr:polyprenyl synthetase family protein [Negativicutes bacterium]